MPFRTVPLVEIAETIQYGFTASAQPEPVGPRFLRITDIVPERLSWDTVPFCAISNEDHDKYRLMDGDIVIARTGATVGYAKCLRDPPDAVFASYLVRVRVAPDNCARYVGYVVTSEEYKRFIAANAGGAAQPNASAKVLTSYPTPLPDSATQRKIATILTSYDDLIENNSRRIQILEEMAQSIYRDWFVEFRFPGYENVPLVESEPGPIPTGWKWKELRELAEEVRRGIDPTSVDPDTPYFGLEHLPEHSMAIQEWGRAADAGSRKYAFEAGEILFGKIRPYFHKVGIPPVTGICSTDAIVIRPRNQMEAGLVLAVVSSDAFIQHAVQTSQGTKMPKRTGKCWRSSRSRFRKPLWSGVSANRWRTTFG